MHQTNDNYSPRERNTFTRPEQVREFFDSARPTKTQLLVEIPGCGSRPVLISRREAVKHGVSALEGYAEGNCPLYVYVWAEDGGLMMTVNRKPGR